MPARARGTVEPSQCLSRALHDTTVEALGNGLPQTVDDFYTGVDGRLVAERGPARCGALDQLFAHMLLVIKTISDLHGAGLQAERLKAVRRVKPLCRQVLCIDAKHQLDGVPLLGRVSCRCRQKRLCDSSSTV